MTTSIPTIARYMTRAPILLESTRRLTEAHALMREFHVRHLPVVDDGVLVGLLSMDDLHLIETLQDTNPWDADVSEAMTSEPFAVPSSAPLDEVADEMAARKIGSAVVLDDGEVEGIFTTIDALRALAETVRARAREGALR